MIGQLVAGRYQVVKLLGEGGMGAVYEAVHTGTGRRIALKVILGGTFATPMLVARFQREAKAAGRIETQHVVHILDSGNDEAGGFAFLAMEFLSGEDLEHLVERLTILPVDLALRIAAQATMGLVKAHEVGVVHRDIKPANLYLSSREGDELVVKVLDFGIAKVKMDQLGEGGQQGLTSTGSILGSPAYMSPEQAQGLKTIDHRTDLWSIGVVLYEALAGQTPLHNLTSIAELLVKLCVEPPVPLRSIAPWVPENVAAVVHRCLMRDPKERFQTATELLEALRTFLPQGWALQKSMLVAGSRNLVVSGGQIGPAAATPAFAGGTMVLDPATASSMSGRASQAALMPFTSSSPGVGAQGSTSSPGLGAQASTSSPGFGAQGSTSSPGFGAQASTSSPGFGAQASTTGGTSQQRPKQSSAAPIAAVAILLVLGGGAFAGYKFLLPHAPPPASSADSPVAASVPTPVATATASASSVAPASASASAAPVVEGPKRTVRVVILPSTALVEVDGVRVVSRGGIVELTGPLDSTRHVHAHAGTHDSTTDVRISANGAVPPAIDLGR